MKTNLFSILTITGLVVTGLSADAQPRAPRHPRRTEVNRRLANQNRRIDLKLKKDELTKAQANALHKEDHQILQEERDMAAQNGGHITKAEQITLNQQENHVSNQIGANGVSNELSRTGEVNKRLSNQNKEINAEQKDGQISATKADALHKEDAQIHQEEKDMQSQDGGNITRSEYKVLNQQENHVLKQIQGPAPAARLDQVNDRLANQNKRIDANLKSGKITASEAEALHKNDAQIHQEDKDMASQDNGGITKQEQKTLNQQENKVSKEIGN